MKKDKRERVKEEIASVKDMVVDFVPRLTSTLLNPTSWQSPENMSLALGGIASSFVGSRLKGLIEEIWSERDEIDQSFLDSEQANQVFIDLIRFVAQENPEDETWNAAKKIFKQTLKRDHTEQDRASLFDMLHIVTELSGSEIRILAGSYVISLDLASENNNHRNINGWADRIVDIMGFATREQVLRYEDNLVKQKLIAPREHFNGNQLETWHPGGGQNGSRLSSLGCKLARFLSE